MSSFVYKKERKDISITHSILTFLSVKGKRKALFSYDPCQHYQGNNNFGYLLQEQIQP
jgi:hypothetical protein